MISSYYICALQWNKLTTDDKPRNFRIDRQLGFAKNSCLPRSFWPELINVIKKCDNFTCVDITVSLLLRFLNMHKTKTKRSAQATNQPVKQTKSKQPQGHLLTTQWQILTSWWHQQPSNEIQIQGVVIKRNWLNLKDKEWVGDSDDYYGTVYEKGKYVSLYLL